MDNLSDTTLNFSHFLQVLTLFLPSLLVFLHSFFFPFEECSIFSFHCVVNKHLKVQRLWGVEVDNLTEGGQDKALCPPAVPQLSWLNLTYFITTPAILLCGAARPFTPTPTRQTLSIYVDWWALLTCTFSESPSLQLGLKPHSCSCQNCWIWARPFNIIWFFALKIVGFRLERKNHSTDSMHGHSSWSLTGL